MCVHVPSTITTTTTTTAQPVEHMDPPSSLSLTHTHCAVKARGRGAKSHGLRHSGVGLCSAGVLQ